MKEKESIASTFARGFIVGLIALVVSISSSFLITISLGTGYEDAFDGLRLVQSALIPLASFLFAKAKESPKHFYVAIAIPIILSVWDLVLKPILM